MANPPRPRHNVARELTYGESSWRRRTIKKQVLMNKSYCFSDQPRYQQVAARDKKSNLRPSSFPGAVRPVKRVRFEDKQGFMKTAIEKGKNFLARFRRPSYRYEEISGISPMDWSSRLERSENASGYLSAQSFATCQDTSRGVLSAADRRKSPCKVPDGENSEDASFSTAVSSFNASGQIKTESVVNQSGQEQETSHKLRWEIPDLNKMTATQSEEKYQAALPWNSPREISDWTDKSRSSSEERRSCDTPRRKAKSSDSTGFVVSPTSMEAAIRGSVGIDAFKRTPYPKNKNKLSDVGTRQPKIPDDEIVVKKRPIRKQLSFPGTARRQETGTGEAAGSNNSATTSESQSQKDRGFHGSEWSERRSTHEISPNTRYKLVKNVPKEQEIHRLVEQPAEKCMSRPTMEDTAKGSHDKHSTETSSSAPDQQRAARPDTAKSSHDERSAETSSSAPDQQRVTRPDTEKSSHDERSLATTSSAAPDQQGATRPDTAKSSRDECSAETSSSAPDQQRATRPNWAKGSRDDKNTADTSSSTPDQQSVKRPVSTEESTPSPVQVPSTLYKTRSKTPPSESQRRTEHESIELTEVSSRTRTTDNRRTRQLMWHYPSTLSRRQTMPSRNIIKKTSTTKTSHSFSKSSECGSGHGPRAASHEKSGVDVFHYGRDGRQANVPRRVPRSPIELPGIQAYDRITTSGADNNNNPNVRRRMEPRENLEKRTRYSPRPGRAERRIEQHDNRAARKKIWIEGGSLSTDVQVERHDSQEKAKPSWDRDAFERQGRQRKNTFPSLGRRRARDRSPSRGCNPRDERSTRHKEYEGEGSIHASNGGRDNRERIQDRGAVSIERREGRKERGIDSLDRDKPRHRPGHGENVADPREKDGNEYPLVENKDDWYERARPERGMGEERHSTRIEDHGTLLKQKAGKEGGRNISRKKYGIVRSPILPRRPKTLDVKPSSPVSTNPTPAGPSTMKENSNLDISEIASHYLVLHKLPAGVTPDESFFSVHSSTMKTDPHPPLVKAKREDEKSWSNIHRRTIDSESTDVEDLRRRKCEAIQDFLKAKDKCFSPHSSDDDIPPVKTDLKKEFEKLELTSQEKSLDCVDEDVCTEPTPTAKELTDKSQGMEEKEYSYGAQVYRAPPPTATSQTPTKDKPVAAKPRKTRREKFFPPLLLSPQELEPIVEENRTPTRLNQKESSNDHRPNLDQPSRPDSVVATQNEAESLGSGQGVNSLALLTLIMEFSSDEERPALSGTPTRLNQKESSNDPSQSHDQPSRLEHVVATQYSGGSLKSGRGVHRLVRVKTGQDYSSSEETSELSEGVYDVTNERPSYQRPSYISININDVCRHCRRVASQCVCGKSKRTDEPSARGYTIVDIHAEAGEENETRTAELAHDVASALVGQVQSMQKPSTSGIPSQSVDATSRPRLDQEQREERSGRAERRRQRRRAQRDTTNTRRKAAGSGSRSNRAKRRSSTSDSEETETRNYWGDGKWFGMRNMDKVTWPTPPPSHPPTESPLFSVMSLPSIGTQKECWRMCCKGTRRRLCNRKLWQNLGVFGCGGIGSCAAIFTAVALGVSSRSNGGLLLIYGITALMITVTALPTAIFCLWWKRRDAKKRRDVTNDGEVASP